MAMLTKSGISGSAPISEINVTPMVDVMLVLLIIFMITAPMLTTGLKVNLPQSKAAQILNPKEPVVITIMKNNVISLGDHPIARDDLISAVKAKLQGNTSEIIHIRGDKQAAYGDIVAVIDLLASNGLTHVGLLSDARSMGTSTPGADPAQTATATANPSTLPATAPTP